jgi:hypothetical protein
LDKNIFRFDSTTGFECLLHENVIVRILAKKEASLLEALLESDQKIYSLIDSPTGKGLFLESLFRSSLSKSGTNFSSQIKDGDKVKKSL